MKRLILILLTSFLIFSLSAELDDRIVAKVGSDIILLSDVYKMMYQMQMAGIPKEQISMDMALREIIEQKVISQKAKELNIKVDDDKIKRYAQNYLQELKSQYPSPQEFQAALAQENITEAELLEYFIEEIKNNAMTQQLIDLYVSSQVSVTEEEMREFYNTTKDSMAVKPTTWETGMIKYKITASKATEDSIYKQMQDIKKRLDAGADFATLASEVSECPSKVRGGDLGYFSRGMMLKPIEDAAFSMDIGEISGIIRSENGYHILKLTDKRRDEVRASHILKLVQPTKSDTLAAYAIMERIRELYESGQSSFSDLALQYSTDPDVTKNKGIIGELTENEFPEPFKNYILSTPVGKMTPVLEKDGTLYIFVRLKEIPPRVFTYDEVKDKLYTYLYQYKLQSAYNKWIDKLIKETYVEILEK